MPSELLFTNAQIVTPDEVVAGEVLASSGLIVDVQPGRGGMGSAITAIDCEGDYLIPGLIELHTDNLEKHVVPRPGVLWPIMSALLTHDAQMATAGVTTVLDSLCIGTPGPGVRSCEVVEKALAYLERGQRQGAFRAEHLIHLRVELSGTKTVEHFSRFAENPLLRLVSLMDHTPGQRQWRDLNKYMEFNRREFKLSDEQIEKFLREQFARQAQYSEPNRKTLVGMLQGREVTLASHDDTLLSHVAQAKAEGIQVSEFPTTIEAASAAREAGMAIIAGAPNVVLGGSHSGNVAAEELARRDLLDTLSSDYVPSSLLEATFLLSSRLGMPLPRAMKLVTATPSELVGLSDRGSMEVGKRADLVRVRPMEGFPVPVAVWRQGQRIV